MKWCCQLKFSWNNIFSIKKPQSVIIPVIPTINVQMTLTVVIYALCVNCLTLSRSSFFFAIVSKKDSTKTRQEKLLTYDGYINVLLVKLPRMINLVTTTTTNGLISDELLINGQVTQRHHRHSCHYAVHTL